LASPQLAGLAALNLRRNGLTDAAAQALLEAPLLNLHSLRVEENEFSPALREMLRRRYPFVGV
jgi:hypothetical protein